MKHALTSWKTTLLGAAGLALTLAQVYHDPKALSNPATLTQLAGSVGLIAARDADKQ